MLVEVVLLLTIKVGFVIFSMLVLASSSTRFSQLVQLFVLIWL